jgi:hypothetical protein
VVTDVRFKNEIKYIQDNGGIVIRIRRGEEPEWYDLALDANQGFGSAQMGMRDKGIHQSEWDWIGSDFDMVIENNGTIDNLGKQVDELLLNFKK